ASVNAESGDDNLDADKLECDIGHRGNDAGDRHGKREPAVAEAATHEICCRDVAVLVADMPEARKDQKENGENDDGVRDCEERDRARAIRQRRHGDEGIGGIEISAEQKPCDEGAEAPTTQPPFMKKIEIALTPPCGSETEPGDEGKQQ